MPKVPKHPNTSGWVNKLWFALENNDQRSLRILIAQGIDVNHIFKVCAIFFFLLYLYTAMVLNIWFNIAN